MHLQQATQVAANKLKAFFNNTGILVSSEELNNGSKKARKSIDHINIKTCL